MAFTNTTSPVPVVDTDPERTAKGIVSETHAVDEKGHETDSSSELKQDGVKQVEAVTAVWSPAMMWAVFGL